MLNRVLIVWIVYAGVMGFAVGGSFVAAYQTTLPQHETSTYSEQNAGNQTAKEKADEALARYTWWLTVFTGIMAFATVGLGIATVGLYSTGEQQIAIGIKAANAADKSARASIGIQLPILRATPDKLSHGEYQSGSEIIEDCSIYAITLTNRGSTKAFPKEVLYGWTIGEELPLEPKYRFSNTFDVHSIIEPNGTAFIKNLSGVKFLKPGEWSKICAGNYLWFYCCIIYDDFMDETRSQGFCWKWAGTGMGVDWRAEKSTAYNQKNAALSKP
jgi:hypothetical protein